MLITNTAWVRARFVNHKKGCIRLAAASDKVYQLLAHGRWFSPGTPASSTTKTGRHDIAEILLKVALSTKNQIKSSLGVSKQRISNFYEIFLGSIVSLKLLSVVPGTAFSFILVGRRIICVLCTYSYFILYL
jgi:hypothetical protein